MAEWELTDNDLMRDRAGFLRRACPNCDREFMYPGSAPASAVPQYGQCGTADAEANWWTDAQSAYARDYAFAVVGTTALAQLREQVPPRNLAAAAASPFPMPSLLIELDDLTLVRLPCHPDMLLKIAKDHRWSVGCLVCGKRYPLKVVRNVEDGGLGRVSDKVDRV